MEFFKVPRNETLQGKTDLELIESYFTGNEAAFNEIYNRYKGLLISILTDRLYISLDDSRGLSNELFIKAMQAIKDGKFDPKKGTFKAWISKITTNYGLDHLKKRKVETKTNSAELDKYFDNNFDYGHEQETINKMDYEIILPFIEKLSPQYRKVFKMFYLEDKSYEEIASELNISISSTKTNLHKAKANLKRILAEEKILY